MGFTTDLLTGIAQRLDAETAAVWEPLGVYTTDQIGIVLGVPTQQPPSLVALAAYGNADDPALSDSTMQMQVRVRAPNADPRPADDLADAVFDTLQGLHGADLIGGVRLVYARRVSTLPLGIDGSGRQERADNYDLMVHRPSAHRE
jgi:hypothetical protein